MERNVTINAEQELYVIRFDGGCSCLGFDVVLDQIDRTATELVGRGVLPESFLKNPVRAVKAKRGTIEAYDMLQNLNAKLESVCKEQNDRAVCDLSPQLAGLEGHRVEVVDRHGDKRRFIVGKSTGWKPIHLEIKRSNSLGGQAADLEYESVRDLGKVW